MNRTLIRLLSVVLLTGMLALPLGYALSDRPDRRSDDMPSSPSSRVRAPEFQSVNAWLNTDRPITMKLLRGQVVLLDFWTYCCINCMHVFPDLKYLEEKYHDESFVVIGVHSGKFSQEKDAENIRQAVLRHNIEHPVAVDSDYEVWNSFGVRAWPTLILIDPEGYVVGMVSGEGHREVLDQAIGRLLKEHREKGTLGKPMRFQPESATFKPGVLSFPGKVLADADSNRLFISDTNHHRILVCDLDGRVQSVVGSGDIGMKDGPFAEARFYQPQGLALTPDNRTLYVADTENHLVRAVNLADGTVATVAGTGEQSYDYQADGPARTTALSSPWDLVLHENRLYIAMAGTHQIWVWDIQEDRVHVLAGTGREACVDARNHKAAFAQPSGLATDGNVLYVADSEISTIRTVEIDPVGHTRTLAGSQGLFIFGHRDGPADKALFQHPLGLALVGDQLYVADTFNSRIRKIDLPERSVTTWLGTGETGLKNGDSVGLYEPGGLSATPDFLYIADTNHHRVIKVQLKTKIFEVLELTGI